MKGDASCTACHGTGQVTDPKQTYAGRECTNGLVTVSLDLATLARVRECLAILSGAVAADHPGNRHLMKYVDEAMDLLNHLSINLGGN